MNRGASIITYTILVLPYYSCSIVSPKTLFYLIVKAPIVQGFRVWGLGFSVQGGVRVWYLGFGVVFRV